MNFPPKRSRIPERPILGLDCLPILLLSNVLSLFIFLRSFPPGRIGSTEVSTLGLDSLSSGVLILNAGLSIVISIFPYDSCLPKAEFYITEFEDRIIYHSLSYLFQCVRIWSGLMLLVSAKLFLGGTTQS